MKPTDQLSSAPKTGAPARKEKHIEPRSAFSRLVAPIKEIFFFLYLYRGYVQLRDFILALLGKSRATILYYHRIGGCDTLTKPTDKFRRDLDYLKKRYECVSLLELCERLHANKPLQQRSVVITFDDGYRDNFTEAVPALKQRGVAATFFVATGFIGTKRDFPHDLRNGATSRPGEELLYPKLTWDDLRKIEADGFEIGSHTVNHLSLANIDEFTARLEINNSLSALIRELGPGPRAFSFPWGKLGDISETAINEIGRAGYYAALSAYGGSNTKGASLFHLCRVDVGNGHMSTLAFRARVAGLDPDYFRLTLKRLKSKFGVRK